MPQETVLGEGALSELPAVIGRSAAVSHVVVTGRQSYHNSGASRRLEALLGKTPVFYIESELPDLADFTRFRRRFAGESVGVIAIGGGHVIDTAKLISTDATGPEEVERRLADGIPFLRIRPLITIPTTAGSGSEATPFAVVYVGGVKHSIDHPTLKPDTALVDPTLLLSLDGRQFALSGLDALAQSIEALLSRRATSESDAYARVALSLAWPALPALQSGRRPAQFRTMAEAANLAGKAIAITRTTAPHALSYYLTARFGVPHGQAIAFSMGHYLALFSERMQNTPHDLEGWRNSLSYVLGVIGASSSRDIAGAWTDYVESLGLESSPGQFGIDPGDLQAIHHHINADRLANSPMTMSVAEIDRLWGAP